MPLGRPTAVHYIAPVEQGSFDLGEEAREPTLTVLELVTALRDAARRAVPGEVWVRGEVQNLRRSQNGHVYFALVERSGRGDQPRARIDVTLFRDDRRAVTHALAAVPGAELADDVEVRIRGRVELYAPQGRLQVVMTGIDPVFTVGEIAVARERVLRELAADGLLAVNGALAMPIVPLRVGLVTSAGSAAYHDFVQELQASGLRFAVDVVDVRVQGAAASRRIVYGLRQLAGRDVDVVVVARGGGSRADLAPFDTDLVARAIASMPMPVVVGVGHEVDRSVADEVAHTSCKTPTACAQLLVERVRTFVHRLDAASHRVAHRARAHTALATRALDDVARRIRRGVPTALAREGTLVERHQGRLEELARLRTRDAQRHVDECARRVGELARARVRETTLTLDSRAATVRALDPRRVLERGYSVTRDEHGRAVRRVADVAPGALLFTEVTDGVVVSTVDAGGGR